MEQTTNVFNKGLQTDTHPMVQGNDTLSDALNATLVTMNGNEVVLQNDMGNAKIDNAYLPPGYLPVGMKEYGGIIYVAAYNPITNKSLIGSFPSPERKISVEDKDLGNTIDLDTNFRSNKLEGINFLDNDILLIPLTSDTSLHAGDKFTVYSSYIWLNKNNITNFDNIILYQLYEDFLGEGNTYEDKIENLKEQLNNTILDSDKEKINHNIRIYLKLSEGKNLCYSPKNKKYTLSLGILNSLNEFVDITKSLVRWKDIDGERPIKEENESDSAYNERLKTYRESIKPIEFTNESDLIKFNTGYFIAKDFVDPLEEYAGNDKELIAERLRMAVNSYAYKLIGPLYLKAELNHIKNFNFSIEGTKIPGSTPDSTDAEVLIRATITYNCPDGINTISRSGDNNYFDYFVGKLKDESIFPGFHLYKKSGETYEREYTTTETEELLDENNNITIVIKDLYDEYHNTPKTKYNPETNLYEVTIEKKYIISPTSDNKYEYYVCIPSGYKNKDGDDIYIKGLSTKGEIDFNKLGSGTLEINEWRFYNTMPIENNEGNTLLSYEFNVYPRIGHTFSDLEIKLNCSLIGLLIDRNDISELTSIDEKAAATWFLKTYLDNGIIITPSNYTELIDKVNTLWINIDRDLNITNNVPTIPQFFENNNVIEKIKNHVENGGNLYLTKFASHLIKKLNRTNINTFCRCSYNNITTNNYPKLYAVSEREGIYNNMIVSYDGQSNKYCEFIERGSGGLLKCRYYVFNGTSADDYTFLGKMVYADLGILTGLYPSIIEFLPKKIENNNEVILDQKGSIIVDGSIYLWTGSLNVLKHNVETLTKNTINYLNSKKNKMLNNIQQLTGEFLSHKGNINISWKELDPRTLYDVLITYKEKDENDLYIQENGSDKVFTINNEWILTTELFNNCYSTDSLDFVDDYARFNNLGENLPNGLKYLVDKLLTVKLDINENIKYTSEESSDYSGFEKLISKNSSSENIESSVINKYKFNFILNRPSISISNEILYPAYINNEIISDFLGEISFDKSIDVDSIQKNIYEHQSGTVSPFVNIVRNEQSIPEGPLPFNFGGNIINVFDFTTYITQKIALKLTSKSINIENCFSSFDTVFSENNNDFSPYCCFGARCPGDCGGTSPKILMYLILYSTPDYIANANIENSNQNLLLFEMDCHGGNKVDVYNFSTYFDRISEFFNKNHENSQFIVGITNYHEAHGSINAANTLNDYNGNHGDSGNNIFIVWIRTNNGWIPFHIENVTLNNNINFKEKIKSSEYYNKNLKYFHTNFKSSPQSIDLYTIDLDESYHYISPYNFSFPIKYTIKATTENDIIIKIGSNLKFKILKENTLDNNISIKYKSNLNFDDTIKLAIQASLGEGLYSYDIDLDTMEDSEHNILRPEVNYIKIDNKLVKDFEEANNIKVFSENDGIKIFSFPNKTIDSSLTNQTTYPGLIQTQYAAHAKADGEGLSVIGLKFDIGAKKFVTNGG